MVRRYTHIYIIQLMMMLMKLMSEPKRWKEFDEGGGAVSKELYCVYLCGLYVHCEMILKRRITKTTPFMSPLHFPLYHHHVK